MNLDSTVEEKIKEEALRLLSIGRTDWDVDHTLCSVKWMKKLIEKEGGDDRILIPAMYFHDTGYDELKKGYNHQECLSAKKGHAAKGAENVINFFPGLDYFSKEEIDRISYLVSNHDVHNNVEEADRQLVLEADGLAQIDWEDCPPNYDKKNCIEFLEETFKKDRVPYVKTKSGTKFYDELLKKTHKYLEKM